MTTLLELSPEKIALYRTTAQERRQREQPELKRREQEAWRVARQAAQLLRAEFKVTRVVLFGSLARQQGFTRWSDVDIAAWGIAPEDTFRAMGSVMDLGSEIAINLVDVNTARPALLASIARDGVEL